MKTKFEERSVLQLLAYYWASYFAAGSVAVGSGLCRMSEGWCVWTSIYYAFIGLVFMVAALSTKSLGKKIKEL